MDDFDWESLYQLCRDILTYVTVQTPSRDLDPCENGVLHVLKKNQGKGMYPSDIGRHLGIQRPSLTPVLRSLEDRGLICHAPDPADGRRNFIVLSEKYHAMCEEEDFRRIKCFKELFDDVPRKDMFLMERTLETAASKRNLQTASQDCNPYQNGV